MQRAIQNTQAATRRRSRPLRVAGSTLTANVAFAVLKYAALTAAGVLLFRWGQARRATMIRTQRHSRFVLMSLDEIRATRDIVLQTEETKSNFSGSGKTVYICEVVRPCDYQKETDTAADKLAAEIERVNADNRALRRKIERLERELQKARAGE